MIRRTLAGLAALLALFVLAGPAQDAAASGWVTSWTHGYAGFYQRANPNSYEGVEETFTMPAVDTGRCTPNVGMPLWVGMYGSGNDIYPFIQAGVTINNDNTSTGWYEIFDNAGNTVTTGVPQWSAWTTDVVTLRIVWGYGHQNVWFVWSDHTTGQYTAIKRYLPGYYPTSSVVPQYIAEDNYSAQHWQGKYWRIPWFGQINVTNAQAEQTSSTTPVDSAGVPYREGVVKLDDTTADYQMDMWNYDETLSRITENVPQNGSFAFSEHYCY